MSRARSILVLVLCLALCFGAAAAGSLWTAAGLKDWYRGIAKPPWNPPDAVFGPVWTVLYAMMAVAAWRVWTRDGFAKARLPLLVFWMHLGVNAAWTIFFFGMRSPGLALADILVLWVLIVVLIRLFWNHSRLASLFLVPYLLWVTFAMVLNAAIWRMNS